jgi:hypothetical protein
MNHFMQARYADAAAHTREAVTGIPKLQFYWILLAASLAHDNREADARRLLKDFEERFPGWFKPATIRELWSGGAETFIAGREKIIQTVNQLVPR